MWEMSETSTTTTPSEIPNSPSGISTVLADYDVYHSGQTAEETGGLAPITAAAHDNPPGWDISHRRVPLYRPINRHLDQGQRAVFQNNGERAFITVLFTGVVVNALVARLWRATGGRINDSIFKYPLGGEM
ncbi:hypothetical protein RB594_003385 [Gaeumannomyces avenae]